MRKAFIFLFILLFPLISFATERITDYDVSIYINKDATLYIIENIKVFVEGKNIKRGLVRFLPKDGVKYELLEVKRNGNKEDYFTENKNGNFVINTGNDSFLPFNTEQTFTIKYKVYNALQFKDNFAELYWNVSGNGWDFSIDNINAKVILPKNVEVFENSAYIGKYGSKEQGGYDYDNDKFYSPRKLMKGEGITIVKTFDRSYINIDAQNREMNTIYTMLFLAVILCLYYIVAYFYLNKRDSFGIQKTFYPRFDPIKEITPTEAGYLLNKGSMDTKLSIVSIFNMVVKKFLKIEKVGKDYIIKKTDKDPIGWEEVVFVDSCGSSLVLTGRYDEEAERFNNSLKYNLSNNSIPNYMNNNTLFFIGGILLSIFLLFIFLFITDNMNFILEILHGIKDGTIDFITIVMGIVIALYLSLYTSYWTSGTNITQFILTFFLFWLSIFGSFEISINTLNIMLLSFGALSITLIAYSRFFLKTFTPDGVEIVNHLKGLKLFIKTTDIVNRDSYSLDDMEKLIPYSIIFNLEKQWSSKLTGLMMLSAYSIENANFYNNFSSCRRISRSFAGSLVGTRGGHGFGGRGFSGGGFGGGGGRGR